MRRDFQHWIVIEYELHGKIGKRGHSLVTFDEEFIYWGGGPGHCRLSDVNDARIIKDYGTPANDDEQDAIYKQYDLDFPPTPYTWDRPGKVIEGHLAPDGKLYDCDSFGHTSLAADLCTMAGFDTFRAENELHDHGWITVRYSVLAAKWPLKLTKAQVEVLDRLKAENAVNHEPYRDAIDQFLNHVKEYSDG